MKFRLTLSYRFRFRFLFRFHIPIWSGTHANCAQGSPSIWRIYSFLLFTDRKCNSQIVSSAQDTNRIRDFSLATSFHLPFQHKKLQHFVPLFVLAQWLNCVCVLSVYWVCGCVSVCTFDECCCPTAELIINSFGGLKLSNENETPQNYLEYVCG